jgi:plastocyanin
MIDVYTRRALFAGGIGLVALAALMLGGNTTNPAHRLQASDRMTMSDAAMARWSHDFYATHPVRGAVPALANAVIADTFLVNSFYFDTDNNTGTQIDTAKIQVGQRILFKYVGGFHTATSGSPNDLTAGSHFDVPIDPSDLEAQVQFDTVGTYPFFCRPHGAFFNMRGVIVVKPSTSGIPAAANHAGMGFTAAPWPNPTSHGAAFRFALPRGGRARIDAYDASGRRIVTVLDEELTAGEHAGTWDGRASGRAAAAGVYYLRLSAPGVQSSARMVIGH